VAQPAHRAALVAAVVTMTEAAGTTTAPLLDAALRYAGHGIHVFPARIRQGEDGKKDVQPAGPWRTLSTTDPIQLRMWFDANGMFRTEALCIDCGKSGLVVVDPDGELGLTNWAAFRTAHNLGGTWIVHTPGGGQHWIYRADPERPTGNSAGKLAPGVDIRAAGGFIIAVPTRDYRGTYRYGAEGEPEWPELPIVPVPVVDAVSGKRVTPREHTDLRIFTMETNGSGPKQVQRRPFTRGQASAFIAESAGRFRSSTEGGQNNAANELCFAMGHFVTTDDHPGHWTRQEATRPCHFFSPRNQLS
jgi:hypothetical protein